MADAKSKDKPKHSSGSKAGGEEGGGNNVLVDAIFWILLILVAFSTFRGIFSSSGFSLNLPSASSFFEFVFDKVQIYSVFLSLVFFIGIIYFNFRLGELAQASHHRIHGHHGGGHAHNVHESRFGAQAEHSPKIFADKHSPDKRWEMVTNRVNSFTEGDWRLAIIEADIILNEMLSKMGYPGEGVAEKLKQADKNNFHSLDTAWEAHKFRNRIAHEGASFHLTQETAQHVIGQYKKVFDEFYFI